MIAKETVMNQKNQNKFIQLGNKKREGRSDSLHWIRATIDLEEMTVLTNID